MRSKLRLVPQNEPLADQLAGSTPTSKPMFFQIRGASFGTFRNGKFIPQD